MSNKKHPYGLCLVDTDKKRVWLDEHLIIRIETYVPECGWQVDQEIDTS